jgi:Calcineurin-like phosphoesterase
MHHSEKTIQEIISLSSLGYSSRKIANIVFGTETKKSTVGAILSRTTKKETVSTKEESDTPKTILFIPDCQVKSDTDLTYLKAMGQYIVDKRPDIVVNAGDFFDFPSLSSYDKGKLSFEGRRLKADIDAGKAGMDALLTPLREYQKIDTSYQPRMVFTLGNHEQRLRRIPNDSPEFEGFLGYHLLDLEKDWEVYDFLKPINIQGINFVHYLSNPMTGKPYGGSAANQLKAVGVSFVVGHKQTLDVAIQPVLDGTMRIGIVAGASYLFDEDYKGQQLGNNHFRGVIMLYGAKDGYADASFISTKFLISRLE